jgi:Arc/MetJ-type ribon-helix-helix transcriptional regulator
MTSSLRFMRRDCLRTRRRAAGTQRPDALYADRGYDHVKYREQVREAGIKPVIARPPDPAEPARRGMVTGMASKKVTVTLDERQLDRIRALVAAGMAASVSGFVQHAVGVALDDVAGWGALLAEALRETGGALSDSERAWADQVLGVRDRPAA